MSVTQANFFSSYLFYDIETTGLNPCFDQILQFAAIRTDLAFNEIERHEIQIRLNTDVIPSPSAMITHRIRLENCLQGEKEMNAILKIHQLFNTPGTISLGYNTLGFDDEFLRFAFYRNLLTPYTHQYANGCSRMDLYPITLLYFLYKPQVLKWPQKNSALLVNLKLANLNTLNHLSSGPAHQAIVDTEAIVALAKKLAVEKEMWNYSLGYFNKEEDQKRISEIKVGLIIHGKIGSSLFYQAPVIHLGPHLQYKNQSLWMRLDLAELSTTTLATVEKIPFVIRKKIGEQEIVLPWRPRFLCHLSSERQMITQQNLQWLEQNPHLLHAICHYYQNYQYPKIPHLDVDAALYETPFSTPDELFLFRQFHQSAPTQKLLIAQKFPQSQHRNLALRIMQRNYSEYLSEEGETNTALSAEEKRYDYRGREKLTIQTALTEITQLEKTASLDQEQCQLLKDLKKFIEQRRPAFILHG